MIQHNGGGSITIYLSDGNTLTLSEIELREIIHYSKDFYDNFDEKFDDLFCDCIEKYDEVDKASENGETKERPYHKQEMIIDLFNKYKSKDKTKAQVFREISKELNITYKAVEKAYYKK